MTNAELPTGLERFIGPDGVVQRVRLAAYAWCEQDGALLLVRVAEHGSAYGQWMLPGGGCHFGEDPRDGVVREVAEETGLDVVPGELLGVRSAVLEPGETITGQRIHTVGVLYRASVAGGSLHDEVDGSTDLARWIGADELDSLPLARLADWAVTLVRGA
ncbi:MAG TPA: NUDIX domain-containing protein [Candidatus Limnocylindrales bacterium]